MWCGKKPTDVTLANRGCLEQTVEGQLVHVIDAVRNRLSLLHCLLKVLLLQYMYATTHDLINA
jgi:hypothetical protein